MERGYSAVTLARRGDDGPGMCVADTCCMSSRLQVAVGSRVMLNDEAASLRISGSPVHKRASKPNLGDSNPSIAAVAKYGVLCCFGLVFPQ